MASAAWDTPFETTSKWNSVRMLLAHCNGAEERWINRRLQDLPLPVIYEERAAPDWEGLYADHRTIRAATYAYLAARTDAELASEQELMRFEDKPVSLADVLFHIFNHENYHRGQVITALQRLGVDPPNFDYCIVRPATARTDV